MRILCLDYDEPILKALCAEFQELGYPSLLVSSMGLDQSRFYQVIDDFKPDVCLSINFDFKTNAPDPQMVETVLREKGVQAVSWFIESPEISGGTQVIADWFRNTFPKNFHIITSDTYYISFFKNRGLTTDYLPMGVNLKELANLNRRWRNGDRINLFWSGTCYTGGLSEDLNTEDLRDYFIYLIILSMEEMKGQKIGEEARIRIYSDLNRLFSSEKIFNLDFKKEREKWINQSLHWHLNEVSKLFWQTIAGLIDIQYSWFQTHETLKYLNSIVDLDVQGSERWNAIISQLRTKATRLSRQELFNKYTQSFASLCLTKQTFGNFIHEKVWAIFSCRGFPIADERSDLFSFLDKSEIAVYSHRDQIPELIDFYSKNLMAREKIVHAGYHKATNYHSYAQRAKQLIDIFKKSRV